MNAVAWIEGQREKYLAALRREIQKRREKDELLGVAVPARPNGPGVGGGGESGERAGDPV